VSPLAINARFRTRPLTGVERFATEVVARLGGSADSGSDFDHGRIVEHAPDPPLAGLRGHAWEQFALPRRLDRDAILFSPCNTGPLAVVRQLVVVHDAAVWDCPEGFSAPFRHLYRQLLPALAKRAAAVATVSEFSRSRLAPRLGIAAEAILVLGNAAGPAFSPGEPKDLPSPGPSGSDAPPPGPVFLCVGSMDPRKNLSRLVKAWLELQDRRLLPETARLQFVGGANPRNFADFERPEGHGIDWLGRLDDAELVRRYREADAFVYPSTYEGFGLPPLEAMACGCPVLLSAEASLPEVGGPPYDPADPASSGAALYFDPFSEAQIAAALLRFLELSPEAREQLRRNALARAAEFSWDRIAAKLSQTLARL